jgi:hypothetical protein
MPIWTASLSLGLMISGILVNCIASAALIVFCPFETIELYSNSFAEYQKLY